MAKKGQIFKKHSAEFKISVMQNTNDYLPNTTLYKACQEKVIVWTMA